MSSVEQSLFFLPARMGGLGVRDPVQQAADAHSVSRSCSNEVVVAIKNSSEFCMWSHLHRLHETRSAFSQDQQLRDTTTLMSALDRLDPSQSRAVKRCIDGKTSGWLCVLPLTHYHFDLSAVEFRDALSLRYHRPLLRIPSFCDGCGESFSFCHALDCRKGGLVTQRHNEIRDALGDLAAMGYKEVLREPVVREANDTQNLPALIADLSVRGVWQAQTVALFDVRVVDTDAQSYINRSVHTILASAEAEKNASTVLLLRRDVLLSLHLCCLLMDS